MIQEKVAASSTIVSDASIFIPSGNNFVYLSVESLLSAPKILLLAVFCVCVGGINRAEMKLVLVFSVSLVILVKSAFLF